MSGNHWLTFQIIAYQLNRKKGQYLEDYNWRFGYVESLLKNGAKTAKWWSEGAPHARVSGHHLQTEGGARGIVVIVVGNGHGDTSSNPGRDWLHFT